MEGAFYSENQSELCGEGYELSHRLTYPERLSWWCEIDAMEMYVQRRHAPPAAIRIPCSMTCRAVVLVGTACVELLRIVYKAGVYGGRRSCTFTQGQVSGICNDVQMPPRDVSAGRIWI